MVETLGAAVFLVGAEAEAGLAQVVPERQARPVGILEDLVVVGEERVGQEHGDLLLARTVEQAQAQLVGAPSPSSTR